MTEEIKPQEGTPQDNTPPELTPIEQKALEMGWRPKDQFEGEEDDFIDAKEFVRRKPLFDKIETQSKEIKNVRKAIDALKQHYTVREEAAVNAALKQLKEARQEAITNADGEAFDKIDSEIKSVEKEQERLKQLDSVPVDTPTVHPEFAAWSNRNQWYTSVGYMRKWADDYGTTLSAQGLSPSEVLKKVEDGVKKEFPQKFTNPNKSNAPSVESGSQKAAGSKKDDFELSDQERRIMNTLVSTKVLTKEEYISQLKAAKGIK